MKVLAIMGSPRKGDSLEAVRLVEERMKALGGADPVSFEYLFLKDADLKPCRGCNACFVYGEEKCPRKDGRDAIAAKMQAADGVLFATPAYNQTVTALMKNFLERTSYFWHRPAFFRQKAVYVAVGGGMMKELEAYLKSCIRGYGMRFAGGLSVPHLEALTPKFYAKTMKGFDRFAEKFYRSLADTRPYKPTMGDIAWFEIWRVNTRDFGLPRDVEYWRERGWLDKPYYTADKVGLFKRLFGKMFDGMMSGAMRKIYKLSGANETNEVSEVSFDK